MFRIFCLILIVCFGVRVRAETNETLVANYVPSLSGQPWPRVPVVAYTNDASGLWVHPTAPKDFPTLQEIHETNSDFTTVVLRLPDGTVFKTYNDFVLGPYLAGVFSGDFNGDGVPDFMAIKPGSGCGIAGENCTGVFAFSDNGGYRFTRVRTMGLGPHALVQDPQIKSFRLIQTSLRAAQSSDGRIHSFWVHRFYKWEGYSFRSDTGLPPIWIQYLNRPNHEATKLLSAKQKLKAWGDDAASESPIEW